MACLSSSSRVCARVVQEKLCQLAAATRSPSGLLQPMQQQQQQQHVPSMVSGSGHSGFGQGSVGGGGGSTMGKRTVLFPLFGSEPGIAGQAPGVLGAASATVTTARSFYSTAGDAASFTQPSSSSSSSSLAAAGPRVKHLGVPVIGRRTPPAAVPLYDRSQKGNAGVTLHPCMRGYSSVHTQQPAGPIREYNIDPYILLEDELKYIFEDIRQEISRATNHQELNKIAVYYFDGQGKAFRPMVAMLMAKALNYHMHNENSNIVSAQRQIAMISEMIHTASLVHDDVIDQSFARRGKPSVNVLWNHKKVTQAGDYILSVASMLLARLKHDEVTHILSQVLTDLVQGEFMQLGSKETENERFAHYFTKTYRKTASLIANSLKAVAVLSGADDQMAELSFQYGRNLGLAFQFVDDLLDFVSSSEAMGKPAAADLKLGLATAPVLFACEKFPELNPMILRRFREPGDVERAYELVHQSQGLEQTRFLARKHCIEALRLASQISESPYQKGLIVVGDFVLNRMK
ncbi:all trans-polyprenyl-diphosphate synthase PDSS1 [Anopheles bellator]|uniref:all trans-polyprenyl-diphosphate synthase PDSS1 n=1 Tax=Anopheles bellator TaxID=139047 RepID=UPI0026497A57|nr:all trans-polyprenyl-diphosphate synthase PDSS1 [Anopheles bellator]